MTKPSRAEITELEMIPNVGPSIAGSMRQVGVSVPGDLLGKDPYAMYDDLCRTTGVRHDPCVLDVFIAAVRFMDGGPSKDRSAGPAEIACVKIDFADWLRRLPRQKRRIAETLACGESTGATAKKFEVSPSRISRFRKECFAGWQEFQGEPTETAEAAA